MKEILAKLSRAAPRAGRSIALALLVVLPIAAQSTTWTGAASAAWSDPANWTNGVPTPGTNAVIAVVATPPTTTGAAAACRHLTVPAGATLDLAIGSPIDVHGNSDVDGVVTGGGKLRFVGASGSVGGDALPDCEIAAGGYVFVGAIVGDLVMTATATTLRTQGTVTGDATLLGGTIDMFNGLARFDVAGNLTIQTTGPVTSIPGGIHVGGTLTTNANFQPTSGTILFVGSAPQTVSMPTATFHGLAVEQGSSLTLTQPLTVNGRLDCRGALTTSGGSLTAGGAVVVAASGSLVLQGATAFRGVGGVTVNGAMTGASTVLDVDGVARFSPGSTTALGNGIHLFSDRVQFFGALTIPSTAIIALDGATGSLDASASVTVPNVEIRAGDHGISSQVAIGGRLDHLPTAGVLSTGNITVGGDAVIGGAELRTGNLVSFEVDGSLTITTSAPTTATFGSIRVGGDWTSNANWQPGTGTVILDGAGTQTVTMPSFFWNSLTIEASSAVTLGGPLTVTQDLNVQGSLVVSSGGAQVGDTFLNRASGSTRIVGASVLDVGGTLTSDGVLDVAQGVLAVDGNARFNGSGTLTLGAGPHMFGAGLQMFGPLVVPPATEFVMNGSGEIAQQGASLLPDVRIAPGAGSYTVSNTARIAGDLLHEAGAGPLTLGLSVSIGGDLTCLGASVTSSTVLSVNLDGNVTIDTPSPSQFRTRVTIAGDLNATSTFDASNGILVFDGATTQTVTVPSLTTTDLRIDPTTQLVLNVADLTVLRDLDIAGSFSTPRSSLTVGRDLIIEAGGALDVGPGDHRITRNLRNLGAAVTGAGELALTGSGQLSGGGAFGNLVVDAVGATRSTLGAVTVAGDLTVVDGTLSLAGGQTLTITGDATMHGGTLAGGSSSAILDLNGNASFDGTAAGTVLPVIRCAGDWSSNATFRPTSSRVELDGSGPTRVFGLAPGFDPSFFDLRIGNGTRELGNDLQLDTPTMRIEASGGLVVGPRRRVGLRCVGVTIDGVLEVRPGARLLGDSATNVHVGSTGTLRLGGEPGSGAGFWGQGGGGWSMLVDGTIDAAYFDLRGMGAAGVRIGAGATIQALHDGVFGDGSPSPGSVLLDVSRSTALDLDDVGFVDTNGTGTFNVRSSTTAPIRFRNWSGNFGGPQFEDDPNGVVDWVSSGRTELASFSADGRIGRIELSFATVLEVDALQFRLARATAPDGPFVELPGSPIAATGSPTSGASYALTDSTATFPTRFFYRLEEERPNGVRRLLATDFARALPTQTAGGGYFVGSGGFPDVGAALAAAPAGAAILVEPGTYPGFTVSRSATIAPLGDGRIQVAGPVVVQGLAAGGGGVMLQGLDLLGAGLPLDVSGCLDVVVLDDIAVTATVGGTGVRVTGSPQVAVQSCSLTQGAASLLVASLSVVYVSDGTVDVLDVRTGSRVVHAGLTPLSTLVDPTATVTVLTGNVPRMEFDTGWPALKTVPIEVRADPGDLFGILVSTSKSYTELSSLPMFEMVLLLDQSLLLTLDAGLVTTGTATASLRVPEDPAAWGTAVPVQVVVLRPALGKVRFGNVRDAVILP